MALLPTLSSIGAPCAAIVANTPILNVVHVCDGWALARIFSARGFQVQGLLVKAAAREVTGDAAVNLAVARKLGLDIRVLDENGGEMPSWAEADLVIDALRVLNSRLDAELDALKGPAN